VLQAGYWAGYLDKVMANGKFIQPELAPDLLARQLKAQRKAEDAARRLEQAEQPLQGQMVSGHYIAPHWTQNLAQGLNRFTANRDLDRLPDELAAINKERQDQMLSQFGFGSPSPQALAQGLSGGGQQPMLLPGLTPEQSMQALQILGEEKYMQAYAKQFEPTNEQRNLAHLPQNIRDNILTSQALSGVTDDGITYGIGSGGQMVANPIQGFQEQRAAQAGAVSQAQERAKAERDLVEVPTGDGGSRLMSREDALKALGGAQGGSSLMSKQEERHLNEDRQQGERLGSTPPPLSNIKERRDFEKSIRADIATGERTINLVDRNIAYIDRLLDNAEGLEGIVGQTAQFKPTLLMLDKELEANADIDTIKSKVVLQTMEEMRKSSAAGATGFGNMNREQLKVIQDALGSLERAQTIDQITENLLIIRNNFEQMRNSAISDFDAEVERYGEFLGDRYKSGMFGETRATTSPSDITGSRDQRLSEILGF